MPTNITVALPPPLDSAEFQQICCDVWRRIWNDPYAQLNGRSGQDQNGVDVVGHPNQGPDLEGVECKVRNVLLGSTLTYSDVIKAVNKAEAFEPSLSKLIVATTAPTDASLQEAVRLLNEARSSAGRFPMKVVFWDFIKNCLADEPALLEKHYPAIYGRRGSYENVDLPGYLGRLYAHFGPLLPPLLPLTLTSDGRNRPVTCVVDALQECDVVCLVGDSGSGKTHLARHLVIDLAQRRHVPIFAAAKHYDGHLDRLLDRSVAHLTTASHRSLVEAAGRAGAAVALVVDALNECADALRPALVEELTALRLANRISLLITSRPDAVTEMPDVQFGVEPPSAEERERLIGHYGAIPADLLGIVRSPLDIRIAAEAAARISRTDPTPYDVHHAYCRGRLGERHHLGMRLLAALASRMAEMLTWSLAEADIHRVAAEIAGGDATDVLANICASGLFEMDLGRGAFWHERLQAFFLAESILCAHPSPDELRQALSRPRNEDAADFVIAGVRQLAVIDACLSTIETSDRFSAILDGELGPVAKAALVEAVKRLLQRAHSELDNLVVNQVDTPEQTVVPLELQTPTTWSDYDYRLMGFVGDAFKRGFFLDDVVALLGRTQAECLHRIELPERKAWRKLFPVLYGLWSPHNLPAGYIAQAIGRDWNASWSDQTRTFVSQMFDRLAERSPGELNLLLAYVRQTHDYPGKLIPLLKRCWETGIYHLRLEAGNVADTAAVLLDDDAQRDALERLLDSFVGNNPFLNSVLFGALAHFRDLGVTTGERAREEVRCVLSQPPTPETCQLAAGIFSNQFEEVLGNHHFEAIQELRGDDWLSFHVKAALGSTLDDFATEAILSRLVERPAAESRDAFLRFAVPPPPDIVLLNGPPTTFWLAHVGLARICANPPELPAPRSAEEESWQQWGVILFWSQKQDVPESIVRTRCEPAWQRLSTDLLRAAIDPLFQMERYVHSQPRSIQFRPIRDVFPRELKNLLERSLAIASQLTSINSRGQRSPHECVHFMLATLAHVGDELSLAAVEPLCESAAHGRAAVRAVKAIRARMLVARRDVAPPTLA